MRGREDRAVCDCKEKAYASGHWRSNAIAAKEGEPENAAPGYLSPLLQALIEQNEEHVNVVVCESDYRALKRGIGILPPPPQ
jgi:hypothetical protein